tara:strand:- start:930 stop:1355 length:426 start_codon:yes stop_codon:yes gene_type:complete
MDFIEKELRKKKKQIRRLKRKTNWDMNKINELDDGVLKLEKKISLKNEKYQKEKDEKEKIKGMNDNDWIDHYYENPYDNPTELLNNHKIENNFKNRRHKRKIIQKLNEHMLEEHMLHQIERRRKIIQCLKDEIEEEKEFTF